MGTYKKGILGAFSGKVGTVVGSFWRSIAYIRSLASHVRNPKTASQEWYRGLMGFTAEKLRPFLKVVRLGFVGTGKVSPWSKAVQVNRAIIGAASSVGGAYVFDASKLVLSSGSESMAFSSVSGRGGSVDVSWTPADSYSDFHGGTVYVVAWSEANGRTLLTSAPMESGSLELDLTPVRASETDTVRLYGFAVKGSRSTATTCF